MFSRRGGGLCLSAKLTSLFSSSLVFNGGSQTKVHTLLQKICTCTRGWSTKNNVNAGVREIGEGGNNPSWAWYKSIMPYVKTT